MPHRIYLRGPWEYEWLDGGGDPPSGHLQMPASWTQTFGSLGGRAIFRRRFQWPSALVQGERVVLVLEGIGGTGRVVLNCEMLCSFGSADSSLIYDITSRLRSTNRLEVELSFNPSDVPGTRGGLWGPVVLEIYETSGG